MYHVIDSHVHLGMGNMPSHCYDFLKSIGLENEPKVIIADEEIELDYIVLIPSFPCGNKSCTDGFYSQLKLRKTSSVYLQMGTINPNCNIDVKKELENQYSKGIIGIKLHPVHHYFKPNAYRQEEGNLKNLEIIYSFAEDMKLPIVFHTGTSNTSMSRNKYGDPIYIDDVIKDFPRLKIVLAHSGRPLWTSNAYFMARNYANVYLEISSIPPLKILSYLPGIKEIRDRVIYGSDFPNYKGQTLLGHAKMVISSLGYDSGIMRDNFMKIFKVNFN
ncbi:amidohydrolase family protein [Acidianus brierleyi]|uniref:Amidohydrolase n=1 Tax=Acidianus brierleyi TaxID=41673 RepID=A0A2U9IIK4_9CREN|nr:amidohydrolase family protein [Acidianus brierleyi]AWR95774.1 amidohydrolase family protein [Acidianus brierleyi]